MALSPLAAALPIAIMPRGWGPLTILEPSTSPTQLFPATLRGGGAIENHGGAIVNYVSVTLDEKMYSKEIRA